MSSQPATANTAPVEPARPRRRFDQSDATIARRYVVLGYLITGLFLVTVFAWAAFVPISSAAIANGVVSTEGYRQTVQHLEGGIVHAILVKDGDPVVAGQKLIELADLQTRSEFDRLQRQRAVAAAKEASLIAAQLGRNEVDLPAWLELDQTDPAVRDAIAGQIESSIVTSQLHKEQIDIIEQRVLRAEQKTRALREEEVALLRSRDLIKQELEQYASLFKEGLISREAIFSLERQAVENQAAISSNHVAVQSTQQEINELHMERSTLVKSQMERISSELDSVREQLVSLDEKMSITEDMLERTVIRAPTSGVVVDLKINTVGGVIAPGQPLLSIVPNEGSLIIDARIDPIDRDAVRVTQDAEIRFPAFNRRVTNPVRGRVTVISADRLVDAVTNTSYYQAKIELLEDPRDVLGGQEVYPGMQAEVFILIGSQTALSYLVTPIAKSFNRAFREDY